MRAFRPYSVLVVDDMAVVRMGLRLLLEEQHCRVETACDGEKGLDAFKNNHFDLVITDNEMPNLRGEKMIEAIRAYEKAQGVCRTPLYLSSSNKSSISREVLEDLLDGDLGKPVQRGALDEVLSGLRS
jgi:two-component system, NarL family, sensor histidine kinase EvgS